MPLDQIGRTMPNRPVEILDDFDVFAEQYAHDRAGPPPAQASRLRDETIRQLLPFANRLAGRYRHGREPADDLEQVARLGLVKAIDRYDPERGSFTAYAMTTILGELKRYFRDHSWGLQVPRRLQDLSLSRLLNRTLEWLRAAMLTEEAPAWPAEGTDTVERNPVAAVRRQPTGLRVVLAGEVDQDNAGCLREALLRFVRRAPAGSRLEIDLAAVPLLAAAGVTALLAVYEAGRVRRVEVIAVGVQPFVRQIAVVSGLGVLLRSNEDAAGSN